MSDAVRVLIVAPAPLSDDWAGGISNFVRSFVRHMPDDFAVSIASIAGAGDAYERNWRNETLAGREVRFMPVAGLPVTRRAPHTPVKASAMWGLLKARRHVPTRGAVVQVHAPAMDLPLLLRRAQVIRVVHNAPDNLAAHSSGTSWRHFGWALRRIEESSFRRAQRVFFVDRATYQRYAARDDDGEHMYYLPNGVDTAEFAPLTQAQRTSTRHDLALTLGVRENGPWLLFCGRLDRQKDPELLIATFAQARRLAGLEDAQLIVVGRGPLQETTVESARAAGVGDAAHFVGPIEHDLLPRVMGASDALILSSAYEGAPFVVLEALASGLPVVSTAVGDVPLLVQHVRTGWIASTRSAAELARGVAWAVGQPRDEIAPRAAASMRAYRIEDVLAPFYDAHRRVAQAASE